MLDTWNESIFSNIKNRLQDSAMKLVHAERLGEAFDSQLVIGVRESYGEKRGDSGRKTVCGSNLSSRSGHLLERKLTKIACVCVRLHSSVQGRAVDPVILHKWLHR